MLKYAGIVRNDTELLLAQKQLRKWTTQLNDIQRENRLSKEFYELINMTDVGLLIIEHSLMRTDNKGVFVKIEQPRQV